MKHLSYLLSAGVCCNFNGKFLSESAIKVKSFPLDFIFYNFAKVATLLAGCFIFWGAQRYLQMSFQMGSLSKTGRAMLFCQTDVMSRSAIYSI